MSKKNDDAKRSARERMQVERERQRAADKRKRALIVGGSVVAVLAVAATIGVIVGTNKSNSSNTSWSSVSDKPLKLPTGMTSTVVPYGSNPNAPVLTVYEDFRCPICDQVEGKLGATMQQMADAGQIRIDYHIASFLDKNLGGNGSKYAANAAACAQDAGKFKAFHDVLYANQPDETNDKFGKNSYLLELAGKVDGLRSPTFDACVNDLTYAPWVKASQEDFNNAKVAGQKVTGTPTIALNDQKVQYVANNQVMSPDAFKAQLEGIIAQTPKS
ncbi:DsbA family protein [Yinghuangia seranimata]|uniref:DsbA family protein n=1 Tax=Yinghuangia seranimata TaxID=408067 RepID=UPI00248B49DE|nr:thioredoxin domain-containing protein [Yinghuangia seranimata]MDI2126245.1 thioredoxin domain-containing protein [Yinghuangia seranimata]